MLETLAALALSAVLGVAFLRAERAGRPERVVLWVLGVLVVEGVLYPQPFDVPLSVVHPQIGGLSFRLVDVVLAVAIATRLRVRGVPRAASSTSVLWLIFLGWLVTEAALGVLGSGNLTLLFFELKVVLYLGVMIVVADVPAARWTQPSVAMFLRVNAVFGAVLVVLSVTKIRLSAPLPLLPLTDAGDISSDAATIFAALGLLALGLALASSSGRVGLLLSAGALLVTTVPAGQRAALIFASIGLLVLLGGTAAIGRRWVAISTAEVLLVALGCIAVATPSLLFAQQVAPQAQLPFASTINEVLNGRGKQLSAEGRLNQWRAVRPVLSERPVLGHGLGATYQYFEPGPPARLVRSDLTHNLEGDLLLRTGLVGLVLFAAAVTSTLMDGVRAARRRSDPVLAGLVLATTAGVVSWLAKAQVESLFEKYRLAVLLGLLIGLVRSLASDVEPEARDAGSEVAPGRAAAVPTTPTSGHPGSAGSRIAP